MSVFVVEATFTVNECQMYPLPPQLTFHSHTLSIPTHTPVCTAYIITTHLGLVGEHVVRSNGQHPSQLNLGQSKVDTQLWAGRKERGETADR